MPTKQKSKAPRAPNAPPIWKTGEPERASDCRFIGATLMTLSASSGTGNVINVPLGYYPFPKQNQFHGSPAKYRLFGGAAGPGKSKALLFEAILQADQFPGANVLLLRRTFPELEHSLVRYFREDVPRELYKSFHESKHVVTWHNGSTIRFGYCQRESDVCQYQAQNFFLSASTS
jgi:hypothetical protein